MAKKASDSTADHSKFKELQKTFKTAPEVTKACLTCHTEAAKQIQKTKHWTFEFINPETQQKLGKKHVINKSGNCWCNPQALDEGGGSHPSPRYCGSWP